MTFQGAHRLKRAVRVAFVIGNVALIAIALQIWSASGGDFDRPWTDVRLLFYTLVGGVFLLSAALIVGLYLSIFLGVDVFGLSKVARLLRTGLPEGKPFDGFAPGEAEVLRFDYCSGGLNRDVGFRGIFKLLLTNRRLLVGANLTTWFLVEFQLSELESVAVTGLLMRGRTKSDANNPNIILVNERKRNQFEDALCKLSVVVR